MKIFPLGRASNSARGMPTPIGPHHFCRCSGCVNTSKTRSRGASKTRSMTSSLIGISTTLSLAAMSLLLHLQFLQVLVQTIEPLLPDDAIALDPFVDLFERARLERRRPPLRLLAARHESRTFEHLEVLAHRREAHLERLRDLGHRRATLRETREDRTPRRVGEGTERETQAVDSHVAPLIYLTTWFITSGRRRCQGVQRSGGAATRAVFVDCGEESAGPRFASESRKPRSCSPEGIRTPDLFLESDKVKRSGPANYSRTN